MTALSGRQGRRYRSQYRATDRDRTKRHRVPLLQLALVKALLKPRRGGGFPETSNCDSPATLHTHLAREPKREIARQ